MKKWSLCREREGVDRVGLYSAITRQRVLRQSIGTFSRGKIWHILRDDQEARGKNLAQEVYNIKNSNVNA